MPKRRTTRNAPAKRESKVVELSPEELKRREGIDLILKDFDKQVESRVSEVEREMEGVINSIHTLYKVELLKLPHSTRNMKWDDYVAQCQEDGSNPQVLSEAIAQVVEDVRSEVDSQVTQAKTAIKSTAKKKGRPKKAPLSSSDVENTGTVRRSTRKAAGSTSRILSDSSNLETPATAARSTRGRKNEMETPAVGNYPVDMGRTPFITPRFNIATPLTKTVSRVARTNEVLVSLKGSPVQPISNRSKAAQAEAANNALIPLGKGQTLNLPIGPDAGNLEGFQLDDDALSKLAAIRDSLTDMLKIRDQSSASSDDN